jgi:hypothetical protein
MRTVLRCTLLLLVVLATGCDSDSDDALDTGEFVATTSGAAEQHLRGDAAFAVVPDGPSEEALTLTLRSGTFQPPDRPYEIGIGIEFRLQWEGRPGSIPLSEFGPSSGSLTLPSARSFGFPAPFRIESGTVTVEEATAERVSGRFEVVAVEVPSLEVDGVRYEVQARGEFMAAPEE